MKNAELFKLFLKQGEEIIFESIYYGIKKGTVLNNYKNGEIRVEYNDGKSEEIIGVEQILFITKGVD